MELQSFECSTCQICFYGITNYQRHVNGLDHAKKVHFKSLEIRTDEDKEYNSNVALKHASTCNITESVCTSSNMDCSPCLQCELCQKQFTGNEPYQQHLASAGHKKKLAKSSNPNNPTGLKCEVCDKYCFGIIPYEQHMMSSMHKKKVLAMELKQKSNLFASLHTQPEIQDEINAQSQNDLLESSSEINNLQGNPAVQNSFRQWECSICDKTFSGHIPYEQHMSSYAHTKLTEREVIPKDTCSVESLLDNRNDASSAHMTSVYRCELCEKNFTGRVPYDQHMSSPVHKKKVQDKDMLCKLFGTDQFGSVRDLKKNTAFCTSNGENTSDISDKSCLPNQLLSTNQNGIQLKCEVCDKSFTGRIPFDQHMSSANHQKKMLNNENKNIASAFSITSKNEIPASQNWFCQVCNKQCSGYVPYNQHIMSDAHLKKMRLVEMNNMLKEKNLDSANSTEDINEMSAEDNSFSLNENVLDGISPIQYTSDLSFGDVLKDMNFVTLENLNVAVFGSNEKIVFDVALKDHC